MQILPVQSPYRQRRWIPSVTGAAAARYVISNPATVWDKRHISVLPVTASPLFILPRCKRNNDHRRTVSDRFPHKVITADCASLANSFSVSCENVTCITLLE
ncbi:hypothetical protein KCP74_20150 [Salmonella enterica subsp. enterica]|nr:hypothetical protein KCP74_20150 [Salmonella enterica subsp. enterica]